MKVETSDNELYIKMETSKDLFSANTSAARYSYEDGNEIGAGSLTLFLPKETAQELVNKINEVMKEL